MKNSNIGMRVKVGPEDEIEAPVFLEMTNFLPAVVAQHMAIQHYAGSVVLSFFELDMPFQPEISPEAVEEMKREGFVAECVARVTIPMEALSRFAQVMTEMASKIAPPESEQQDDNT